MHSAEGMKINLDIQTRNKNKWSGGIRLKLNTPGLKGSLEVEPEKRTNSSSKHLRRTLERQASDTSRFNLSRLYSNLKKSRKPLVAYETERKKYDESEEKRLSFNSNKKPYCNITVVEGENRHQHNIVVGRVEDLMDALRHGDQEVVGYSTVPTNLTVDFYLTQLDRQAAFLNGQSITLKPLYRNFRKRIDMRCFDIIKCIGAGGFSKVFLVRFKEDGKFYAMKLIDKHFIAQHNKKGIVQNQRNIMVSTKHPFILDLKFAFQSADFLVFVLDYCPGGELFTYVKKFKRMPEDIAKFYMIEILLAIEHLHMRQIIYRDIKPENILIDMEGHVKLADFGLAKPDIGREDMAYSFCGSPEYMAPEMILKLGHGPAVDFYCIGALLYELVTGLPPYYSKNTDQIYESVLTEELTFPKHTQLSQECRSVISGLLNKNYKQRLGALSGVREVLAHPWFGRFKRQDVLDRKLVPPVKIDDVETLKFDFEKLKHNDMEMMGLILQQKKTENQYFRKLMKNFYYDSRKELGSRRTQLDEEQQTDSRPTLKLHQKRVEDNFNHRYFSPRGHSPGNRLLRNDSSTSRIKKVSSGKNLNFKKKMAPSYNYQENTLMEYPQERGFKKLPITRLKQTQNKTYRS